MLSIGVKTSARGTCFFVWINSNVAILCSMVLHLRKKRLASQKTEQNKTKNLLETSQMFLPLVFTAVRDYLSSAWCHGSLTVTLVSLPALEVWCNQPNKSALWTARCPANSSRSSAWRRSRPLWNVALWVIFNQQLNASRLLSCQKDKRDKDFAVLQK